MLEHLKVSNVALIEEAAIDFAPGLNVLSGETGAGKSILIDSINFVLGSRVPRDFIRSGAEAATVEAFVTVAHAQLIEQIADMGVNIGADRALLIFRSQTAGGRSVLKINGKPVTIGMLREIASLLIDVHGQHEHQSLLNTQKHLQLLDRFCQDDLGPKKARLAGFIAEYRALQKAMADIPDVDAGESRVEMYRFQVDEIAAAGLTADEEERLYQRRKLLLGAEKIVFSAAAAAELLRDDNGALDKVARVLEYVETIAALDADKKNMAEALNDAYAQLEDAARDLLRYTDSLEHDPQELDEIEARLDQIYRLKQKYGRGSVTQVLEHFDETVQKLNLIENGREELARLAAEKKLLEKEIGRVCLEMSKIRKDAAGMLESQIEGILRQLGMEAARFTIEITNRAEFGTNGFDRAEFMISANVGEPPKPLSAIASGGEMSRVMLALKTALASYDTIETFIFDEIDAGISGRTAQQVAEKLSIIGKNHQILCITHLPQIAAMGDANFAIEKSQINERTFTYVHNLEGDGKVAEIARLIGGAAITSTTEKAAKEMIKLAQMSKKGK
ncbi:MAG: DNA repair protein RecN [Clostridiales bacterium]|jgi:DNA repair protein RecN (Recombination protein N)|nr:DNA repair protein RecN [Clostridiales bacterium]